MTTIQVTDRRGTFTFDADDTFTLIKFLRKLFAGYQLRKIRGTWPALQDGTLTNKQPPPRQRACSLGIYTFS